MARVRADRDEAQTLSIGALSRATDIPVETLRTWERRYGSPKPIRKPSGHRVYPASVIEQLRLVGRLLEGGHRPAEILGLSLRELHRLLSLADPGDATRESRPDPGASTEDVVAALLQATGQLDREALLHELHAAWARFGVLRFLEDVAAAFMVEVGRAWHEGRLDISREHFASACLSDFLRTVREPYSHRARGPQVVVATLPDEAHEGGLLLVAALLAYRGHRVLYLGANTPVEQIASTAMAVRAAIVAISVSPAMPRAKATRTLARLRRALPARTRLWVGGAGAPPGPEGAEHFGTLAALDDKLARRA